MRTDLEKEAKLMLLFQWDLEPTYFARLVLIISALKFSDC